MTSILRVASPHTKNDENAPLARIRPKSRVNGSLNKLLKCRLEICDTIGSTTAITSMPAAM